MKKSLQSLIIRLALSDDGKLKNGFTSIRGGTGSLNIISNDGKKCENTGTCENSNTTCTNTHICTDTTNGSCTNSAQC